MTAQKKYIAIETQHGKTVIELFPHKAPNHVQRIIELSSEGFYDGLVFHRVINGFMVQAGCPYGNGTGGSEKPALRAEFNDMKHVEGVMSMARSSDPNSANSQFFIMLDSAPYLDKQYTAFGKVKQGMEFIHMIKKGDPAANGMVRQPDTIKKMYVCDSEGKEVLAEEAVSVASYEE